MLWPGLFVMTMGENRKAKRRSYAARGLLPLVVLSPAARVGMCPSRNRRGSPRRNKKSSDLRCFFVAVRTRLELATSGVTGRHSNQLNYRTPFPGLGVQI